MSRYWNPPIGLNLGKNTVAVFKIVILKNGNIQSFELIESSGSKLIDDKAAQTLKSAKLPPMPSQMGESWTLKYGFRYVEK